MSTPFFFFFPSSFSFSSSSFLMIVSHHLDSYLIPPVGNTAPLFPWVPSF